MSTLEKDIHIDAPHLVSHRRRITDAVATAVMWVLYSYLWAPFISLVAWLLGFEFAYDVMVRSGGAEGLSDVLSWYGVILICIIIVVSSWSAVNRYRFAEHERRQSGRSVGDSEIAEFFGLDPQDLTRMRESKIGKVCIDENGHIEQVVVLQHQRQQRQRRIDPPSDSFPAKTTDHR